MNVCMSKKTTNTYKKEKGIDIDFICKKLENMMIKNKTIRQCKDYLYGIKEITVDTQDVIWNKLMNKYDCLEKRVNKIKVIKGLLENEHKKSVVNYSLNNNHKISVKGMY